MRSEALDHLRTIGDPYTRLKFAIKLFEPESTAIDCGANVGNVSKKFIDAGFFVHAFEPDPLAFQALCTRFKNNDRIVLHEKAVGSEAGVAELFFHQSRDCDGADVVLTQSSSLLIDKANVSPHKRISVEVVDLGNYINEIKSAVAILKIDVEGGEAAILEMLIQRELYKKIGLIFVETHEHKVGSIRERMGRIRALVFERQINNVFLDWG
jgi:FkbM family methyltransferase